MSVLVLLIPPRAKLAAARAGDGTAAAPDGYDYLLSRDGLVVDVQARAKPSQLPRADSVVAVLTDADVGWQRLSLPKAPAARLRAALGGALEDHLLEDDEMLHLALAPGAAAGQPTWVAVMQKAWLREHLTAIEAAGVAVDRVLPSSWPGDTAQGHFFEAAGGASGHIMLAHAGADGFSLLRLDGSLARALLPQLLAQDTYWTATPSVAAPAERWLGASIAVRTEAERALQAARSLWNVRQFDLAPRRRGTLALRNALRRLAGPAWRPVRVGVAALVLVQLVGLNAWAWQQQQALAATQAAQSKLLRSSFPQVRTVLDAPLQMQREIDRLRAAAGRVGDSDLEALLGAAASAWPEGQAPAQSLRFESGRLTVSAPGWSDAQLAQFRDRLRPGGWSVEAASGRVTVSRAAAGARS